MLRFTQAVQPIAFPVHDYSSFPKLKPSLKTFAYVWQRSTGKPQVIPTTKISGVVSGASVIS